MNEVRDIPRETDKDTPASNKSPRRWSLFRRKTPVMETHVAHSKTSKEDIKTVHTEEGNQQATTSGEDQLAPVKTQQPSKLETYARYLTRREFKLPDEEPKPNSLQEIVHFLKSYKFDPHAGYHRFIVDPTQSPIQAEDLQQLTGFPYEFSLTEKDGKVLVITGEEHVSWLPYEDEMTRYYSRLSMHTHPKGYVLSFEDVNLTEEIRPGNKTPFLLVSPGGITLFTRPLKDPVTGFLTDKRPLDLIIAFLESKSLNLDSLSELPTEERVEIPKEFVMKSGMVLKEAAWNDTTGLKDLMDIVNLRVNRISLK